MKVLITGGCGFIGSEVLRVALEHGHEVVNLDKLTYAGNTANVAELMDDPRYSFIHGDIADPEVASRAVDGCEVVINLAAESHVDRSLHNPTEFIETDVVGTATLIMAAREAGVRRFVQVSTDEVYGSIPSGAFRETDPIQPSSPYSASKAGSDMLVRAAHHTHGFPALITRCSNNYGPYQFPEKLIPLMIVNALEDKPLPVYGDGSNVREWMHVDDHCRGILATLRRGRPGRSYNLGSGVERS
ncbi:MAG: dTDP-glucose 4,6-dehydratase, partial [Miltoncostaeaceae bacterium]